MAPAHANGTRSYSDSVQARQARFRPAKAALDRTTAYSIDAQFTVPHGGTHIHAFASPPCSSHLYTGGGDGFIRRYALHATLNGSGVDNPLVPNLTSKPGGHERPPGTDTRQPVLSGYWENEEPGDWADDVLLGPGEGDANGPSDDADDRQSRVRWGAKTGAWGPQSAVYSLAVQKEELWGLSGTSRGSINLWTVRHDEGQIRHVFRPAASISASPNQGHSPKAAVSVLALDRDEQSFLSGGWDGRILQWDLDTGAAVRPFFAHSSQISSIAYRPLHPPRPLASTADANEDVVMSERTEEDGEWIDAPGRIRTDAAAGDADERDGTGESSKPAATNGAAGSGATEGDGAASDNDEDAEGEIDDTLLPVSTSPHSILPKPKSETAREDVPLVSADDLSDLSRDVFVSTALDGSVLLWDRRAGEGEAKGLVRSFGAYEGKGGRSGGYCTSACWSPSGSHLYVARRAPAVEIYDLRSAAPISTLALPTSTGPVSALAAMPNGRHLVSASWDCVRIWDVETAMEAAIFGAGAMSKRTMPVGASVIPGHYGGTVSSLHIDPTCRWMTTTSGHRGWDGTSTENLVVYEIRARPGALR